MKSIIHKLKNCKGCAERRKVLKNMLGKDPDDLPMGESQVTMPDGQTVTVTRLESGSIPTQNQPQVGWRSSAEIGAELAQIARQLQNIAVELGVVASTQPQAPVLPMDASDLTTEQANLLAEQLSALSQIPGSGVTKADAESVGTGFAVQTDPEQPDEDDLDKAQGVSVD